MHRFHWLSLLGVTCTFGVGIAGCGDDGGGVPNPPDAATGPDAPDNPGIDAAPGDIDAAPPGGDAGDGPDAGPRPDAAPPVLGGIIISEVVLFPQQDWGKSAGVGLAFDGIAGTGTVSSRDQYIEIHNSGNTAVSLSGWSIAVIDSSDGAEAITPLANDTEEGVVLSLGGGSSGNILEPGDYAVLGNPIGTIANDAYIALRDNRSVVVDDVEIGVDDFADDGDNGAPGVGQNGYSLGEFDEAVARPNGQADTNDDRIDFEKMYATPLGPNVPPPVPTNDTSAPRASAPDEGTSNWPVNKPIRVKFNERLRAASLSPADLELQVNGVVRPIERLSFPPRSSDAIIQAETVGVLPFNATVSLTARASIIDYAGNPLGTDATFTFTTEAAPPNNPAVLINEVCTDPQQDWNHSSDNGTPFTNLPGADATSRSSSDEWIELIVSSGSSVNLTGYTLEVFNGPNIDAAAVQVTVLNDAKVGARELQFSSGTLASVPAGARVVVGNPTGSMENDLYLVLRDNNGVVVDEVEVGGISAATDRGGDGTAGAGAGAPDEAVNGNASGAADETIARVNSGGPQDTGSDTADWAQGAASILQTN
jgi:hypothetical protein